MRKISLVNWETVCKPKFNGGLGFHSASLTNKAYMLKLGWRMLSDPNALWSKVLRGKYLNGGEVVFSNSKKSNLSPTWKAILDTSATLPHNTAWSIGNGTITHFWHDNWFKDAGPLLRHSQLPHISHNFDEKIIDFTINGQWNFAKLEQVLPDWICAAFKDFPPPVHNAANDSIYWTAEASGKFSISSAIDCLSDTSNIV